MLYCAFTQIKFWMQTFTCNRVFLHVSFYLSTCSPWHRQLFNPEIVAPQKSLPALRQSLLSSQQSLVTPSTSAPPLAAPGSVTTAAIRPRLPISPASSTVRLNPPLTNTLVQPERNISDVLFCCERARCVSLCLWCKASWDVCYFLNQVWNSAPCS